MNNPIATPSTRPLSFPLIAFINPGLLDPRQITLMGTGTKSESAIGQFGTGLKFAIAGILRLGDAVEIYTGDNRFGFGTEMIDINGHSFAQVLMTESYAYNPLGFTTELGKHWEPWMIYREFWANAKDEGGEVLLVEDQDQLEELHSRQQDSYATLILLYGEEFLFVHANRHYWLLESAPYHTFGTGDDRVDLHQLTEDQIEAGVTGGVFYKGIRVQTNITDFIYNLHSGLTLTEDRTLHGDIDQHLTIALAAETDTELLSHWFRNAGTFERWLNWNYAGEPSAEFVSVALRFAKDHDSNWANNSIISDYLQAHRPELKSRWNLPEIPTSLWAMLEHEPKASDKPSSYNIYSIVDSYEAHIASLQNQITYWKLCAEELTRQGEELITRYAPADLQPEEDETIDLSTL